MKTHDRALLDTVTQQLASVRHFENFSFISTPLLLPNGGSIVVRVSKTIEGFMVTDNGFGYDEAEMIDGVYYYSRIAPRVARQSGITFDQHSYFILEVTEEQLSGAIITVANCVQEALTQVFYKVFEYKARVASDQMFDKLSSIFDAKNLAREYEVIGGSTHSWMFDSAFIKNDYVTVFEMVTKHHNSIYQAVTKFHDVAKSDYAPNRVAVINQQKDYKDLLPVISQAANVIELNEKNETFLKLTQAA